MYFLQVCPQSKILGDVSTQNMIKITAVRPQERMEKIRQNLKERNNVFKNDPYANAFGISVSDQFSQIDARILKPPDLEYSGKPITFA